MSSEPPTVPLALLASSSIDSAPWGKSRTPFVCEPSVQHRALDTCGSSNHRVEAANLGPWGPGQSPELVRRAIWEKQRLVAPKAHCPSGRGRGRPLGDPGPGAGSFSRSAGNPEAVHHGQLFTLKHECVNVKSAKPACWCWPAKSGVCVTSPYISPWLGASGLYALYVPWCDGGLCLSGPFLTSICSFCFPSGPGMELGQGLQS